MKLLVDHNLPPWWSDTLHPYCFREYQVEVKALSEVLPKNAKDIDVFNFAKDDGWLILTQDKYRIRAEQDAIRAWQIYAFNLQGWEKFPMNEQLGKMFRAVPHILTTASTIRGGGVFMVSYKNAQVSLPRVR